MASRLGAALVAGWELREVSDGESEVFGSLLGASVKKLEHFGQRMLAPRA
jgi:hypothetical protein